MKIKFHNKTVPDLYLNIGHFLDHFMMLIFAKAAFDAGRMFEVGYDQMIIFGTLGMIMFGAISPISSMLADKFGRIPIMIIYHFGLGVSAILVSLSNSIFQLTIGLAILGAFASIYHPVGIAMLLQNTLNLAIQHQSNILVSNSVNSPLNDDTALIKSSIF